jgi:hypothetical protein
MRRPKRQKPPQCIAWVPRRGPNRYGDPEVPQHRCLWAAHALHHTGVQVCNVHARRQERRHRPDPRQMILFDRGTLLVELPSGHPKSPDPFQ